MTEAVLLDLGNVVLGIDFRRVFKFWAAASGVDEQKFYNNWHLDAAYEAHEVGAIDFATYTQHLARMFDAQMSQADWQAGWNDLWTEPFHEVVALLPEVAQHYPLYAFTNTNDTHAAAWRARFGQELAAFRHIFVSSEIGLRKPDKAAYAFVCERMETSANRVLFLDDHPANIRGAHNTGLNAVEVAGEAAVAKELKALLNR